MFEIIMENFLSVFWDTGDRQERAGSETQRIWQFRPNFPSFFLLIAKKKKKLACSGGKKENLHVGALK